MPSDEPPTNVLPFERRRRFPADLDRLRAILDDEDVELEESDIDDGFACAEAAIARGIPGGHAVKADLLNIRAHRILATGDTEAALAAWAAIIASYPTYFQAYAMRAQLLRQRGDHEAALAALDRFVELSPTDARGYVHRAKVYEAKGDGERALANIRRAAQLDPTASELHLGVAQALAAKGDAQGAARAYARVAGEELHDAESYNLRAFMFFVAGQDELALADYEASVALAPNQPDALAWRGLCRLRLNRVDGAIADFTRVIAMRPSEARGYWRRGEALVRAGRPAEALRDLDRAIALGDDAKGAAHFARGMAQEALGDLDAALASYDTAIERDPSNVACRLRRFRIYNDREDWQRCHIDVEAVLAGAPNSPSLLLTHARLCARSGRRAEAMGAYDQLITLEPENADAYRERSDLWVGKGDTLAARADMARAFALSPNDPDIRAAHGCNQVQGATTDEERAVGLGLIASSVELDPENHEAWARAAYSFRQAGRPNEAIPFITRAMELDPENPEYVSERATCLRGGAPPYNQDPDGFMLRVRAALADAEKAIALSAEDDIDLYLQSASLREEAGDLDGALAEYATMVEMAPDLVDAYVGRARLRKLTGDMSGAQADAARVAEMEEQTIAALAAFPEAGQIQRFNLDAV
jgi:tetratricopeptide (TPR) repeat protein